MILLIYYILFYIFISLAVVSSIIIVFSNGIRLSSITIFILSISGILSLMNAGYIAFILIFSSLLYYTIKKIQSDTDLSDIKDSGNNFFANIITASIFGAILASIAGSTMWQGKVYLHKYITQGNIIEFAVNDYYVFFLLIFAVIPMLTSLFKRKLEQ